MKLPKSYWSQMKDDIDKDRKEFGVWQKSRILRYLDAPMVDISYERYLVEKSIDSISG